MATLEREDGRSGLDAPDVAAWMCDFDDGDDDRPERPPACTFWEDAARFELGMLGLSHRRR